MTDLELAIDRFKDEVGGFETYKRMYEETDNPDLKKIFHDGMTAEKQHAQKLLTFINNYAPKYLS